MEVVRKTIEKDEDYLRQISVPVSFDDENLKEEILAAKKFCSETACFALASVQIGIPKRMVILKIPSTEVPISDYEYNEMRVLINPVITFRQGKTTYWESCVSCLDYTGLVTRPYKMGVEYYDENGEKRSEVFEGFEATVVSHEIDHLDGTLHMDVAQEILELPLEERKKFRESLENKGYTIISKTAPWNEDDLTRKLQKNSKDND